MATYQDLFQLSQSELLLGRITSAVAIQADIIKDENTGTANHAERIVWAKAALADPAKEAKRMIWALLAQNKSQSQATIAEATDAQILTAIQNVLPLFY